MNRESRIEHQESRIVKRESRIKNREKRESRIQDRDARIEDRESRIENRRSRIQKRESCHAGSEILTFQGSKVPWQDFRAYCPRVFKVYLKFDGFRIEWHIKQPRTFCREKCKLIQQDSNNLRKFWFGTRRVPPRLPEIVLAALLCQGSSKGFLLLWNPVTLEL